MGFKYEPLLLGMVNRLKYKLNDQTFINVSEPGTANEMVTLTQINPLTKNQTQDVVILHNYDYSGNVLVSDMIHLFITLKNFITC